MLSESSFALGAAILWAISSLIISRGLSSLRRADFPAIPSVCMGILFSLLAGVLSLTAISGAAFDSRMFDLNIVLGGLLIFPIGTGLYYFAAAAHHDKAEVSSQYANVKPALSIAIGTVIFGEAFGFIDAVVTSLIVIGILTILLAACRGQHSPRGLALGLALAGAWAAGDAFIRAATDSHATLTIALGALLSSLVLFSACLFTYIAVARIVPRVARFQISEFKPHKAHIAFFVHGLLSFGLAYALFFHSIGLIGLSRTTFVTVFWPTLALALGALSARLTGSRYQLNRPQLVALALFMAASGLYVVVGAA